MDRTFAFIGILAVLLGFLLFGITLVLLLIKVWKIKSSTKTTGVVIDVEIRQGMRQNHSSPRNTLYKPKVRFQTADGRLIDYQSKISSSLDNYSVGENVTVYYNPQFPQEVHIGTISRVVFSYLIFAFVGGLFAFVGTFFVMLSFSFSH
ncbi:MAG: DUF3592 domain-containing protein [Pyrinomonadaceae bacterium]|nr:DUF3592 domain-containing protein [Pyrinomonadaceae bacterium]